MLNRAGRLISKCVSLNHKIPFKFFFYLILVILSNLNTIESLLVLLKQLIKKKKNFLNNYHEQEKYLIKTRNLDFFKFRMKQRKKLLF